MQSPWRRRRVIPRLNRPDDCRRLAAVRGQPHAGGRGDAGGVAGPGAQPGGGRLHGHCREETDADRRAVLDRLAVQSDDRHRLDDAGGRGQGERGRSRGEIPAGVQRPVGEGGARQRTHSAEEAGTPHHRQECAEPHQRAAVQLTAGEADPRPAAPRRARRVGINLSFFLIHRQDRLSFRLGSKQIVAINDTSIIVEHSSRTGAIATWCINDGRRIIKPIISIEVSTSFLNLLMTLDKTKARKGNNGRMASCRTNIL